MKATQVQEGTVCWFSESRGIGFIGAKDLNGLEAFVHYSAIISNLSYKTLRPGDRVSFVYLRTQKGLQARRVQLLDGEKLDNLLN